MKACAVRTLATWLCFLSCAVTGVATKPGLVVCIGLDGHFDLATPTEGCGDCDPGVLGRNDAAPRSGAIAGSDFCCPCFDLALPPGQQATPRLFSKSPDLRLKAGIPSARFSDLATFSVAPARSTSPLLGDAPFAPLESRRGVVLRA